MNDRRTLIDAMKSDAAVPPARVADPAKEREFVYGKAPTGPSPTPERIPLNTRIRGDFAKLLKRTSLERQLKGIEPHTLQEILEEALEPWMRTHGLTR